MNKNKWNVLLVGGSSGIGKTRLTKALAKAYKAKRIEADDICCAVKAMTSADSYPAIHYWFGDIDWRNIGVHDNVEWLCKVSKELSNGLKAIVDSHIEEESPIIIEGDFISVEFAASFDNPNVKTIYVYEPDETQIVNNYLRREGGKPQQFRASISAEYGKKLKIDCYKYGINMVESRPWNTLIDRVNKCIDEN